MKTLAGTALILLASTPLLAYTVYLKDGSQLLARSKYEIRGDKAIITLQNGTETFIQASEIDVARSDRENTVDYGAALVLEDGKFQKRKVTKEPAGQPSLVDLAQRARATPSQPRGGGDSSTQSQPQAIAQTLAGNNDLYSIARIPYRNLNVADEIRNIFMAQNLEGVSLSQGTSPDRPLLGVTANSEGSVFQCLRTAASALLQTSLNYPNDIQALELILSTNSKQRAGQFVLTPDLATKILAKDTEISTFYVEHVQF
jgi:hypothetical protein